MTSPDVDRVDDIVETFKGGRYSDAIGVGARYFVGMMHEAGEDPAGPTDPDITERLMRAAWHRAAREAFPNDDAGMVAADIDAIFAEMLLDTDKPTTS